MHLTLKKETTRPPGMNVLQQQATFDDFVQEFNHERPHEALAMKCPANLYVSPAARLCLHRKKISISKVFAGQKLGIREVDDAIWLASVMHYDLGYVDLEEETLQPIDNPFNKILLPMS